MVMDTEHKHRWAHLEGCVLACRSDGCKTVTSINDLVENTQKEAYDRGVRDTYQRCVSNGWLRDNARQLVMRMFRNYTPQKQETLL